VKVLVDTSVFVAAFVTKHANHDAALGALQKLHSDKDEIVVAAHSVVELYAVLTRLPIRPRIRPETAMNLIEENVLRRYALTTLSPVELEPFIRKCAADDICGGATYDALILLTGIHAGVERILTFNVRHFLKVAGDMSKLITSP
jgi:predicted nucleic acid-binding protein